MILTKRFFNKNGVFFFMLAAFWLVACKEGDKNNDIARAESDLGLAEISHSNSSTEDTPKQRNLSKQWQDYWYGGEAEITSYKLDQSRYGENREGTAVFIFVTEDFLPKEQVKADRQNEDNIPVLKFNNTKNFVTGIYPYSVMNSTFYPVKEEAHAIKVTQSMQEWCGQVYMQLNNRKEFDVISHSYFEGSADQKFTLPKNILENELWAQLRLDPSSLPVGKIKVIPSFEFIQMNHAKQEAYEVEATLTNTTYTLFYPTLERTLKITYNSTFPYEIEKYEETIKDRRSGKPATTTATKMKTIKSPYWGKKSLKDEELRVELGL